ncbi:hypothetical protein AB0N43_24885 [Streptomyces pseudogriseolus]|uniref:hypothetical protein n=1 Tax=Streptomyces pseudogriseolus TaxID=36817 RepID=UPI003488BDDF
MADDFPTAHTLGWEGRHHRVEGDIWWPHGDTDRVAAARDEAEHHGVTSECGNGQAHRAFALVFTDPAVADDELALAEQLLAGVDLRAEIHTAGVTYTELAWTSPSPSAAPSATITTRWPQRSPGCARTPAAAMSPTTATSPTSWPACHWKSPSRARWIGAEQLTQERWLDLVTVCCGWIAGL